MVTNNSANIPTGASGTILRGGGVGSASAFSTATYPATTTINQILYSSAANVVGGITTADNGVLITGTTGVPSVLADGTTGQVLTATTGSPPSWQDASGGSGITTIDGDSGSISGSTVTIKAGVSALNCGATVEFVNSSTTSTLNVSDANFNTIIGALSGKTGMSGVGNSCVGYQSLQAITSGSSNTSVGYISGQSITTGIGNTAIGEDAMPALTTGNSNIAIGTQALTNLVSGNSNIVIGLGNAYTTSETSNILIGNCPGTVGESLVTRIGYGAANGSQITKCFIDGIQGVSVSNLNMVTINTSTGQLGSTATITVPNGGTGAGTLTGPLLGNGTSAVTALTGNSKVIASNSSGTFAARAFSVNIQTFTSAGTYTPSSGIVYANVRILGGGGAGGGPASTSAANSCLGGGGGAGEYAEGEFSAATIGASQTVTIGAGGTANSGATGGAGGTTSFGALITAAGGSGGGISAVGTNAIVAGSLGGTGGTGGSFRTPGAPGGSASASTGTLIYGGIGGSSQYGAGGLSPITSAAGNAGLGYGSGGSGGCNTSTQSARLGGAGAAGIVVITEYIIA